MFQWAAARAAAHRAGQSLRVDLSWFDAQGAATHRVYELHVFRLKARSADERSWRDRILPQRADTRPQVAINEKDLQFVPDLLTLDRPAKLNGYFQSERYFQGEAELIRRDFTFRNPPAGKNREALRDIASAANAISVHVRRGDYVTNEKTNAFHGVTPLSYYERACRIVLERSPQAPSFWVFSDDPDWCRSELALPGPTSYVDWNSGPFAYEDMRLMSACRHHVIANSSFSWWGAWLNRNDDKVVVAPRQWFSAMEADDTRIPHGWLLA